MGPARRTPQPYKRGCSRRPAAASRSKCIPTVAAAGRSAWGRPAGTADEPDQRCRGGAEAERRRGRLVRCRHKALVLSAGMITGFPFTIRGHANSTPQVKRYRGPGVRTPLGYSLGLTHPQRIALVAEPFVTSAARSAFLANCYYHQDLHQPLLHAPSRATLLRNGRAHLLGGASRFDLHRRSAISGPLERH